MMSDLFPPNTDDNLLPADGVVNITLEHGSLLVMKGATQTYWLHSIPKALKITEPRINLTFRTIIDQG